MQRIARAAGRACRRFGRCRVSGTPGIALPTTQPLALQEGNLPTVKDSYSPTDRDLTILPVRVRRLALYYPWGYMVAVTPTTIAVYAKKSTNDTRYFSWSPVLYPTRVVAPTRYTRLFVGALQLDEYGTFKLVEKGSAILAQLGRTTYLLIAHGKVSLVRTRDDERVEKFWGHYSDGYSFFAVTKSHFYTTKDYEDVPWVDGYTQEQQRVWDAKVVHRAARSPAEPKQKRRLRARRAIAAFVRRRMRVFRASARPYKWQAYDRHVYERARANRNAHEIEWLERYVRRNGDGLRKGYVLENRLERNGTRALWDTMPRAILYFEGRRVHVFEAKASRVFAYVVDGQNPPEFMRAYLGLNPQLEITWTW